MLGPLEMNGGMLGGLRTPAPAPAHAVLAQRRSTKFLRTQGLSFWAHLHASCFHCKGELAESAIGEGRISGIAMADGRRQRDILVVLCALLSTIWVVAGAQCFKIQPAGGQGPAA